MCKVDHPTDWVNQMSVTKKKSGDIRICIDPRPLNIALKHEHFMLPVLDDVLPKLSGTKVFSVCDLNKVITMWNWTKGQVCSQHLHRLSGDTAG